MKKIIAIVITLVLCLSCVVSASAATNTYVHNPDGILTSSEADELANYARMIERTYGYTFIFCLIDDSSVSDTIEYSEDAYYSFTDSQNCYVFTHNTETGKCGTFSVGAGEIFDGTYGDALFEEYNSNESYYGGIEAFFAAGEMVAEENPISSYVPQNKPTDDSSDSGDTIGATEQTEPTTEFQRVERTLPLLVDNADLISADEESTLLARLEAFTEKHEMEIAVVTVSDLEGKTVEEYGDDFYDYNGYGYGEDDDGLLLLIYEPGDGGEREAYISTHADGAYEFYDAIREDMMLSMRDSLVAGDYAAAFNIFVDKAEETMKPNVSPIWLFVFVLVGAVVGLLITTGMASKNYSVHAHDDANLYSRAGSLKLMDYYDSFMNTHTQKVPKAKDNDSDSGGSRTRSSTHTSSSGRSHGGTSMKF